MQIQLNFAVSDSWKRERESEEGRERGRVWEHVCERGLVVGVSGAAAVICLAAHILAVIPGPCPASVAFDLFANCRRVCACACGCDCCCLSSGSCGRFLLTIEAKSQEIFSWLKYLQCKESAITQISFVFYFFQLSLISSDFSRSILKLNHQLVLQVFFFCFLNNLSCQSMLYKH